MFPLRAKKLQLLLASLTCVLVWMTAGAVAAQTYTASITSTRPALGEVAAAASGGGDTVFVINQQGTISKKPGTGAGVRISSGTSLVTVTINCGNQNQCNSSGNTLAATISAVGTPTGRAGALTAFTVGGANGGTAVLSSISGNGSSSVSFTVGAIGRSSSKTINIQMEFPIKDSGTTGAANTQWRIFLDPVNGTINGSSTVTLTGTGSATVLPALSLTNPIGLSFGAIVRPTNGNSNTLTVSSAGAPRSITGTGNGVGLGTPAATRATYQITGQASRSVTVSVPAQMTLSRAGGGSLTVNLESSTPGGVWQIGLGNPGVLDFYVGGNVTISGATQGGLYSGSFNVTATYQ